MEWFLIAFSSALFSTASTISEKKILFKMNAFHFAFLNSVFVLILTLPFAYFVNTATITQKGWIILSIKTILNALAFYYVMLSMKNLELSKALPLLVLTPGFVAFFAFIFFGEALNINQLLGISLLLAGTYILEMQSKNEFLEPFLVFFRSKNYRYIFTALLLFTATSLLDKYIVKDLKIPPKTFLFLQQLLTAIVFLFASFFVKKGPIGLFKKTENDWWKWIIIIALLTVAYRYTQIEAIKLAPAVALVLAVKRISVFFAALIGGKLFNESKLLQKAIAAAIMIAGTFFIVG